MFYSPNSLNLELHGPGRNPRYQPLWEYQLFVPGNIQMVRNTKTPPTELPT